MQLRQLLSIFLMAALLATQGCVAAAIGYGAYAISSSNDEAAQKEAEAGTFKLTTPIRRTQKS